MFKGKTIRWFVNARSSNSIKTLLFRIKLQKIRSL